MQLLGRPIIKKQTGYGFYRPAAVQIANALADVPFSAIRMLIYDIIIYFMTHLARSPGRFFTFHLINYTAFLTMQGFFRTIGLFCNNFDTAFRVAVSVFPNLVLYAGYMIPVNQMKRWLFWVVCQFDVMISPSAHHIAPVLHKSSELCMVCPHGKRVSAAQRTYCSPYPLLGSNFIH
jgi:ABC-type multidrug transport system permease subunit